MGVTCTVCGRSVPTYRGVAANRAPRLCDHRALNGNKCPGSRELAWKTREEAKK